MKVRISANKGRTSRSPDMNQFYLPSRISKLILNTSKSRKVPNLLSHSVKMISAPTKKRKTARLQPIGLYSGDSTDDNIKSQQINASTLLTVDWGSHWRNSHAVEEIIRSKLTASEQRYLSSHVPALHGAHRCSKDHLISK